MMLRFIRRLLLFVVLFGLLLVISPVHAQLEPALSITRIDVQNFPEVKVYLRGENLGVSLTELAPSLTENGKEIPDLNTVTEDVGVQMALLLDASGSILDPGQTGEARNIEVWNASNRLIELGVLSQADWLAAYAPDENGIVSDIQAWTRDYQAVANQLYTYQPPANVAETPLNDLIFFALDRFDQPDVPANTTKKIVLFSDGLAGNSNLRPDDAIERAQEENVPVYTVLLGPETEEGLVNMNSIAQLTGAGTGAYQLASLEALDELWNTLAQDGEQFVLSYRSKLEQPREVLASVTLPNGTPLQINKPFPIVDPQPVLININTPTIEGFPTISRAGAAHDTPVAELDPKTMDIQVEFSWPDGFPRNLVRVEYVIDNKTEVRTEAPFDLVSFPIQGLEAGDYTIRVTAIDELDIRSESEPLSFSVEETRPPAPPTPTPLPSPTPLPVGPDIPGIGVVSQQTINTGLIILTLIVSLLALAFAMRKPAVRERVIEAVSTTVQAVTEPFRLNKNQALKGREVKAVLTVEDAGRATSLPATIDIYAGATTRIGRTSEYAEVVIEDKRVSRLHCRMAEEPNGKLRLFDEGGASGTYVNFDPIDINGRVLESGDVINIGPVKFRFDYKTDGGGGGGRRTINLPDDPGHQTEPFQPIAPS